MLTNECKGVLSCHVAQHQEHSPAHSKANRGPIVLADLGRLQHNTGALKVVLEAYESRYLPGDQSVGSNNNVQIAG